LPASKVSDRGLCAARPDRVSYTPLWPAIQMMIVHH
jgi:hypothetical protein